MAVGKRQKAPKNNRRRNNKRPKIQANQPAAPKKRGVKRGETAKTADRGSQNVRFRNSKSAKSDWSCCVTVFVR